MSKKNLIFCTILLVMLMSVCYLSVSPVKTSVEVDDEQDDISISILSTPKSSGYDVTERWNYTSNDEISNVAVSASGRYMAAAVTYAINRGGDPSDKIFFFNTSAHDGEPMWSFDAGTPISSLAISADGEYVVAGSYEDWVAFLINRTGDLIWLLDFTGFGPIHDVDISADGELIAVGCDDQDSGTGVVFLFDNLPPITGLGDDKLDELLWYYQPDFPVLSVAISADGKYVAAGTEFILVRDVDPVDTVFFFNTTDYTPGDFQLPMWSFDATISISSLAISADGYYIVAGSDDECVAFLLDRSVPDPWSDDKFPLWVYYDVDATSVYSVDISASGNDIVLGAEDSGDGVVLALDKSSDDILWIYITEGIVNSVSITADGKYIVAGTDYDPIRGADNESTVFLFNNTGYTLGGVHDPEWSFNTSDNVNFVSISAWGNHFAAGGESTSGETFLFYHARPIPKQLPLGLPTPDDDDDEDEAVAIPFGNFYLIFAALAIVALIIIYKRKVSLSKK